LSVVSPPPLLSVVFPLLSVVSDEPELSVDGPVKPSPDGELAWPGQVFTVGSQYGPLIWFAAGTGEKAGGAGVGVAPPPGAGVGVAPVPGAGVGVAGAGVGVATGVGVGGGAGGAVGHPKRSEPRPAVHGGAVGGGTGVGAAVGAGVGAAVGGGGADDGCGTDDGCEDEVGPAVGFALDPGLELLDAAKPVTIRPGPPVVAAVPIATRNPKLMPPVSNSVPIDRRRLRLGAVRRASPSPVRCMPLTPSPVATS
jgi:hypothetical protein